MVIDMPREDVLAAGNGAESWYRTPHPAACLGFIDEPLSDCTMDQS
jgi:hypothetical protein